MLPERRRLTDHASHPLRSSPAAISSARQVRKLPIAVIPVSGEHPPVAGAILAVVAPKAKDRTMLFSKSTPGVSPWVTAALLLTLSSATFAANPPSTASSAPSKAMRQRMATLHEQMAACLLSDKSISECRAEMRKHCQDMMGSQRCATMMGMGGGMKGMGRRMHGQMTSKPPSTSSPPK